MAHMDELFESAVRLRRYGVSKGAALSMLALSKRSRNSQTPMMLNYEKKQTREILLKGTLFKDISTEIFDTFMDACTTMTFKRGSRIIRQGEIGR